MNQKRLLARVVTVERGRVLGLVPGGDVERVKRGARAVFIPDNAAAASLDLVVAAIAPASDGRLAEASLADRHGGSIAANDKQGDLVTRNSWFEVQLEMQAPAPAELMRGVVRIEAASVSPFAILWRQIARTMVREQSF